MGTNSFRNRLEIALSKKILPEHILQFINALTGVIVGRNTATGLPEEGQDLGTSKYPFGNIRAKNLYLGKNIFTPSDLASIKATGNNGIISSKTTAKSEKPDFIKVAKTTQQEFDQNKKRFWILGKDTPLKLFIGGDEVTIAQDITVDIPFSVTTSQNF